MTSPVDYRVTLSPTSHQRLIVVQQGYVPHLTSTLWYLWRFVAEVAEPESDMLPNAEAPSRAVLGVAATSIHRGL